MWPPRASCGSSQCWASMAPGRARAYSRARRMRPASATQVPSSVKIRTPRPWSSPRGASSSPARALVMQAEEYTLQGALRPTRNTCSTTAAVSIGGLVLGMATRAV